MTSRVAAAVAVLALTTGCGSTVATVSSQRGDGLSAPGAAAPAGASSGSLNGTGPGAVGGTDGTGTHRAPGVGSSGTRASTPGATLPGVSARGPLKIGVLYSDNGAANKALGVGTTASGPREVMAALVAAVNRAGGLAGRQVVVDYFAVDATSSDYATQADAACAHFTQDAHVPVVLDLSFGNRYGLATCLAAKGVADFGNGASDTAADNAVKLFAAPVSMSSTRRYPAVLEGLSRTGYLTAQNKLGVLLEDCAPLQRAYQQAVVPTISRLRLVLADLEHVGCTAGFSSAGPASASVQSALLRFRSRGVDRLLIVSDYEQVLLLLMANAAQSQGWHPGYLLSSTAQTEVMRASIASGQWPQLHGVGWSPGLDIDDPHQALPAEDGRCLDLVKKGGASVSGWQSTYLATTECAHLFFLGAALRSSGGNPDGRALMAAVDALGGAFTSPGILQGRTLFGPGRHDGPAAVAPFAYVPSCSCLRYVAPAFRT